MFYTLRYFKKSNDGLSGSDFNNNEYAENINLKYLLSFSQILTFTLPFSGKSVGKYATVTMSNNDIYYITQNSLLSLLNTLEELKKS